MPTNDDSPFPEDRSPASITQRALANDEIPNNNPHIVTATGASTPGQLCQRLQSATGTNLKTRVFAVNEHVAAAVRNIAEHPVKETTPRGVKPFRMATPLETPDGKYVVRDANAPAIDVEFVADEGVELTAGNATIQVPFGELPADTFATLPDGLFLADRTPSEEAWTITDGDGSVVTTVGTEEDLRAAYPVVWDWFQPDRLSYCADITIHYPDPASDDLHTYEETTALAGAESQAVVHEFLDLFTVHCRGATLDTAEVFDRYVAWVPTAEQYQADWATFARALKHYGDIETARRAEPQDQEVICDRAWRFPPALNR